MREHPFVSKVIITGAVGGAVGGVIKVASVAAILHGVGDGREIPQPHEIGTQPGVTSEAPMTSTPTEYLSKMKPSYRETTAYQQMEPAAAQISRELPMARGILLDPKYKDPTGSVYIPLSPDQERLLSQPLVTDLSTLATGGQALENNYAYTLYDISSQDDGSGPSLLPAFIDPSSSQFQDTLQKVNRGERGMLEVDEALSNYPRKQNFTFMYNKVSDGWVIKERNVDDGKVTVSVIEDVVSPGGHELPILRDSYPLTPDVEKEINRVFGEQ
jgi:hypothetical protein